MQPGHSSQEESIKFIRLMHNVACCWTAWPRVYQYQIKLLNYREKLALVLVLVRFLMGTHLVKNGHELSHSMSYHLPMFFMALCFIRILLCFFLWEPCNKDLFKAFHALVITIY